MKTPISLFLLLTLLTFCTDSAEDLYKRPYPIVKTNPVTYSTPTGEFNGEIIASNGNQIEDHGFDYGLVQGIYEPWHYASKVRISLGEINEGSKFSAKIPGIHNPNYSQFTVRSYVVANGVTVYGNAAYFSP